jgi:hypothetical protein
VEAAPEPKRRSIFNAVSAAIVQLYSPFFVETELTKKSKLSDTSAYDVPIALGVVWVVVAVVP